jgi:hypothetical protein
MSRAADRQMWVNVWVLPLPVWPYRRRVAAVVGGSLLVLSVSLRVNPSPVVQRLDATDGEGPREEEEEGVEVVALAQAACTMGATASR